jgi:hypothetical protein
LLVELGEAAAESASVVPGQCMGDRAQDAAQFVGVGAAREDPAAVCGIEQSVIGVAQEPGPGVEGFPRGARPQPAVFESCDCGMALGAEAGEVGDGLVVAAVYGGAYSRR